MIDTPLLRRALAATTAVCLVAGVLAAAVVGGDDGGDTGLATTSTTSTSALAGDEAAPDSGAPEEPVATDTTAPGAAPGPSGGATTTTARTSGGSSSPATTAGGATATSAPPADGFADIGPAASGGTVTIPKAGVYRYQRKTKTQEGDETANGTTKIEAAGEGPGGAKKLVYTVLGQGFDSTSDVLWGQTDVKITKSVFHFGGRKAECDWEPDYLEMKMPLSKGATWEASSSCQITGFGPAPIIIKRTTTNTVTDARRVRVAGQEIDTWVIGGTEKFEGGGQSGESKTMTWFSGDRGLVVRSTSESSQGSSELVIQNLQPE